MDFLKFAEERYSVRKFENKHLEKEVIDKILKAGHIAPTGCNFQPQRIQRTYQRANRELIEIAKM